MKRDYFYTKLFGIALYQTFPNNNQHLISRRTLWHIYEFTQKFVNKFPCFEYLFDDYVPVTLESTETHKPNLKSYIDGFNFLLNEYSKDSEEYYEIRYLKEIFTLAKCMEKMTLIVSSSTYCEPFCPEYSESIEPPEEPKHIFLAHFPAGITQSFIFGKITFEEFAQEFIVQHAIFKKEKSYSKLIFTDKLNLQAIEDAIKTFNIYKDNIESLRTKIAKLFGEINRNNSINILTYYKPLLKFTHSNTFWKLQILPTDRWYNGWEKFTFASFPPYIIMDLPGNNFSWIFATCELENKKTFHIFMNFIHGQEIRKYIYEVDLHIEVQHHIKEYVYTANTDSQHSSLIALSFSNSDVSFINNQVFITKGSTEIYGKEVNTTDFPQITLVPETKYMLNSKETLNSKYLYQPIPKKDFDRDNENYSHFYFLFPLGSKDYENTDFIIKGLTYKGKELSPLKLHLQYTKPEASYEKFITKESPLYYSLAHGLALYKITECGTKELVVQKILHHYTKFTEKASQTLPGFRNFVDFYHPTLLEINQENHSILLNLIEETKFISKEFSDNIEISQELTDFLSLLTQANSMESCLIYDSTDPYNDSIFLPNKLKTLYIFNILPLEKLIAKFMTKEIIDYDPEIQFSVEDFVTEYKKLYLLELNKFHRTYRYDDRLVLSAVYQWVNLFPDQCSEEKLRTEVGKCFGLFSKIQPYTKKDFFKPIIQIYQTNTNWELLAPATDKWEYRFNRNLLSNHFLDRGVESLPGYNYSWFFATRTLEKDKKLAIMVKFNDLPEQRKVVYDGPNVYEEYEYIKEGSTYHKTAVTLSFTNQEVNFDNSKVYFIVDGTKRVGKEVSTVFLHENCLELGKHIYSLNSEAVLFNSKVSLPINKKYVSPYTINLTDDFMFVPYKETGPFVFSSYFFKFPITCEEYENAEFVLDGLSYKGQALPPLKIRINYVKDYELSLKKHK